MFQIIVQNLPADHPVVIAIYSALVVGVLLTYPLQIFPVVELFETWLFGPGNKTVDFLRGINDINDINNDINVGARSTVVQRGTVMRVEAGSNPTQI